MIVMKRGDWKIWGFGAAVVFGLLWFVDFLFALAGVSFLIEWFTVEQLSSESARASAITAAVGLLGGVGALITFLFNYQQKQFHFLQAKSQERVHFQRTQKQAQDQHMVLVGEQRKQFDESQKQARNQHEYEMIFREYSELSRDFASEHELSRINAAINLVRIAKLPDPRFDDERSRREGDRNWILEKYPWFKSTCLQMSTALITYEQVNESWAVRRAIGELAEFASCKFVTVSGCEELNSNNGVNFQPLLEFLIAVLGEVNANIFAIFKQHVNSFYADGFECKEIEEVLNKNKIVPNESDNLAWVGSLIKVHVLTPNGQNIPRETVVDFELTCTHLQLSQGMLCKALSFHQRTSSFGECIVIKSACLAGITFSKTNLCCIHFSHADLSSTHFMHCGIRGSVISESKMINVSIYCSDMQGSNFQGNEISELKVSNTNLKFSKWNHNCVHSYNLSKSALDGADFGQFIALKGFEYLAMNCRWARANFNLHGIEDELHIEFLKWLIINSSYAEINEDIKHMKLTGELKNCLKIQEKSKQLESRVDFAQEFSIENSDWFKD